MENRKLFMKMKICGGAEVVWGRKCAGGFDLTIPQTSSVTAFSKGKPHLGEN